MPSGVAGQPPIRRRVNSELATAHILAEFQYKDSQRRIASPTTCDAACRTQQMAAGCGEECEIPCTADCTDQCVVVCEEPHGLNGEEQDLCCELQNACDNSDCRYSSLDESCCWGCPPDAFAFGAPSTEDALGEGVFDLAHLVQYQHQPPPKHHSFIMPPPPYLSRPAFNTCQAGFRPTCYSTLAASHCMMPCPLNANSAYEGSPIPSLVPSAGESPWSLESSISTSTAPQFSPSLQADMDNPLNVLADYSTGDLNFFDSQITTSTNSFNRHNLTQNLQQVSDLDLMLTDSRLQQNKLEDSTDDFDFSGLDTFSRLEDEPEMNKSDAEITCRWVLKDDVNPKLCGCVFKTREDLHKHIIDNHVKTLKKRGVPASSMAPICGWHGCDSAKKKKIFKLQHLKDHIVCHSKLRMKCELCGKECRDAKVLKLHMNAHRPGQEKPFRCDFKGCGASFGTSALLSSHKRVHTGEKPHKCAYCEYRAADKGNLRRHEEEMHMGKKWPCPYCSQQLAKKANLTRHIRDLHGNELRGNSIVQPTAAQL